MGTDFQGYEYGYPELKIRIPEGYVCGLPGVTGTDFQCCMYGFPELQEPISHIMSVFSSTVHVLKTCDRDKGFDFARQ